MTELPKTFDPAAIEAKWYAHWEATNAFRPARPDAEPFTIVMPPPNVTGSLHIGHALDITLQDILVRHARLKGKDALWVAGTDHAGIATQMVVERNLASQGVKRTDMSREAFVAQVWEWKAQSGGSITRQLRRLGASCDWEHERFTMDEGFSKAVTKVFVDLYNEGLIYRDKRLVNWDPGLKTAISDLEVEQREVKGKFWHFRYPLEDGSGFIAIATTRPETILGDGAVAVNPDDARYAHLVGKRCKLPIVDRLIPIIADHHVKTDFGSGAVKITAAHDWNDYDVAMRHPEANIPLINLMNADATMSDACPPEYRGLDRYVAREKVVADFEALGLLDKIEDHTHMVPFGDRSGVVIEPWLTDQWYVDAKTLAGPAIEAVRSGAIEIVPKTWEKTWFQWLENIQPWCVSRQLWWGHRIPAWYGDDGRIFVAEDEATARAQAGEAITLQQDNDVLDTWFSSALWPFATMGWPDDAKPLPSKGGVGVGDTASALALTHPPAPSLGREGGLLAKHYPNDVLISGFDILFFWDARMAMQGLHFMREAPWKTLYLHGLVRAPDGAKMSKSKGNTVDPLGLIDRYGADALRFFMAAMESQGRDIKMDEKRLEGYRNFATKLWNAARFLQGNSVGASASIAAPEASLAVNKWIIGEVVETLAKLDRAFEDLRFDAMADAIYHFAWGTFCDWYIELVKGAFDDETRKVAGWAFDQILVMLHPFMPFVTEELWHAMGARGDDLVLAKWPEPGAAQDADATTAVAWLVHLIAEIRRVRSELSVPLSTRSDLWIEMEQPIAGLRIKAASADPVTLALIRQFAAIISRMGKIKIVEFLNTGVALNLETAESIDRMTYSADVDRSLQFVIDGRIFHIPLQGLVDLEIERIRLSKETLAAEKEAASLAARLANPAFVERAKPEAVEKARADHAEKAAEAERLRAALARLG